MRLDTFLASYFSKKELKRLFQQNQIKVDNHLPKKLGMMVDPYYQTITVKEKQFMGEKEGYFIFHKPKGVVTANKDAKDKTVLDFFPMPLKEKLRFVGRLDKDTTGLIFLTTNGQLNYYFHQEKFQVEKTYLVTTKEPMVKEDVAAFKKGIVIDGSVQLKPAKLTLLSPYESQVVICEGKFHQVKKMYLSQGKKVIALKRLAMGPLTLPENLIPGTYQELSEKEFYEILDYLSKTAYTK